ncbi:multidrug Resistance Protein family member (mrp-5) [Aphelenchoides avenae]|nr:multidrug Resistance Protein family member (mrp-5) [Aphelenchus avenae]
MSGIFQFAVRSQTALEAHLTAVERVSYYYNNIECESDKDDDQAVTDDWPRKGDIRFENAVLRYSKEAPPALKDVTFEIGAAEKIGIIGRTGSGKSSICNVLFRLYPLEAGAVYVNDVKTTQVSLKRLRRSMAVIPQDAVLFSGTLRFNIDPEDQCTDDEIWATLDKVGLRQTVTDLTQKLDFLVESGGNNLSSGERQLLCVVRALLRYVKHRN